MSARRGGPTVATLAQLAVLALAAWGSTLLPAPSSLDSSARAWPAPIAVGMLGAFIVAAQRRWPRAFDTTRRAGIAIGVCLALALAGSAVYAGLVASWTCRYYAESRIVGSDLTPYAAEYLRREPATSCEELLKRFTGRADEIWTPASRLRRELGLGALHLGVAAAAAAFAVLATGLILRSGRARPSLVSRPRRSEPGRALRPAGDGLADLAIVLSRLVLSHETILRHAQTALRAPELVEIPSPAHARSLWLAVLRRAEIEGAIGRVIDLVLDENPAADELREAAREWQTGTAAG